MADGYSLPKARRRRDKRPLYLVTGGCGFIGSHLTQALLGRGYAVRVLDDLSNGRLESLSPEVEFIQGDVADPMAVRRAMSGVGGCFHLAAQASIPQCQRLWLSAHRTNLTGTINVFDAAHRERPSNPVPVVYASTAAVYGNHEDNRLSERLPSRPISSYGADNVGCELHARIARSVHSVPVVGLRLFNVYGPRQSMLTAYADVISIFCQRLSAGQGITLFGDGQQSRDFIYVGDVVTALLSAMEHLPLVPEVLNLCSGRSISMLDLVGVVAELCGVRAELSFGPKRAGDIRYLTGDPGRARDYIGFVAETDLESGVMRLLESLNGSVQVL